MTDPFESVVGILDQEIDLHRRLLLLTREEQRVLVRGGPAELADLVGRQGAIVSQIRDLEQARLELVKLIADREGIDASELSLSRLVALSRPEYAGRFERQRTILGHLLQELADLNKANALLIRDHLTYLRDVVHLVAKSVAEPGYGTDTGGPVSMSLFVDRLT